MMNVDMTAVHSSSVAAVGFDPDEDDPEKGELHVRFTSGSVYVYGAVPKRVFTDLFLSPSIGRYVLDSVAAKYPVVSKT